MTLGSIMIKPEIGQLIVMNDWISSLVLDDRIDKNKLQLICEEVFSNIVNHAYKMSPMMEEDSIEIEIGFMGNQFILRFADHGMEFNPDLIPQPDMSNELEDRQIGGLGWYLIRHYMDFVEYRRIANKNILYLVKNIT